MNKALEAWRLGGLQTWRLGDREVGSERWV
jgi:hypothetical protein